MKRVTIFVLFLIVLGGGVYLYRVLSEPKSVAIRAEIEKVVAGPGDDSDKLFKLDMLKYDLAAAYESEGRFLDAAEIYKEKVERLRKEDAIIGRRPRKSLDLEAMYLDNLERIYRSAHDAASADQAKKAAAQARARAKRTRHTPK